MNNLKITLLALVLSACGMSLYAQRPQNAQENQAAQRQQATTTQNQRPAGPPRPSDEQLDSLNRLKMLRPTPAGSTRKGNNPVIFLVGDSTMRQGTRGNGDIGQWGWGFYLEDFMDTDRITVENQAMGGMSSRTYYDELWKPVLEAVRPGDWVFVQMGHNDGGGYDRPRSKGSIRGVGRDSVMVTDQDGKTFAVFSFGEYLRKYVNDIRAKGGKPVLVSQTPRNSWNDYGLVNRSNKDSYGSWTKQVAEEMNVPFIDMNDMTATKYETFGRYKTGYMFYGDGVHTSAFGAKVNAETAVDGIRSTPQLAALAAFLKPVAAPVVGLRRKAGLPVIWVVGDSTARNGDRDKENDQWGWGSVFEDYFDTDKAIVDNQAMAGRSARTFLDEGRWDRVYNAMQPGDVVFIQFGHNDGGVINTGQARGELRGVGDTTSVMLMAANRRNQVIYTYGWYIRKFVTDAIEKGATPVVMNLTPTNSWTDDNKVVRTNDRTYGIWSREAAGQAGAYFIDMHTKSADKLDRIGREGVAEYFKRDWVHSSWKGAHLNAQSVVKGIRELPDPRIKALLKPVENVETLY